MSISRIAFAIPLVFIATACAHKEKAADPAVVAQAPALQPVATRATLAPGGTGKANGTIRLVPEGDQLHVIAEIRGLKPRSKHGFHIHEGTECTGPKFETAGGHYNPTTAAHGGTATPHRHPGDLGNLVADKSGKAMLDLKIPQSPTTDSFVGRAVIVHAKADDLKTQPSGDSGDRIACGVIEIEKP